MVVSAVVFNCEEKMKPVKVFSVICIIFCAIGTGVILYYISHYNFSCNTKTMVNSEHENWKKFKETYEKLYISAEDETNRFNIFTENLKVIKTHNEKFDKGMVSFKMGVNRFADMTKSEFVSYLQCHANHTLDENEERNNEVYSENLPDSIDWRKKKAVTEIKDQGDCGSCWAFSATGSLEGQYFIKNKKLISLSEQNLVDCSDSYGNYGCFGGYMEAAFAYVRDKGIESEKDYPYVADDQRCESSPTRVIMKIKSYKNTKESSEADLKKAVATVGPISVAVDATNFQFYSHGIFVDNDCSKMMLNHGVLAVGYGTITKNNKSVDYWIIKNSWGQSWGEKGYMRFARNKRNMCGIATQASYPIY